MAELDRQGGARPPDFGRLSQSGGEDPAHQITDQLNSTIFATNAKDKGIYNKYTCINQLIDRKYSRRVCAS